MFGTEQVDMNSYTPMPCSWPGTVCMITNMTNLDSLNKGSYAHKPLTYSYKAERFSDDYPIAISNDALDGTVQSMVTTIHSKRQRSGPLATDSKNLPDFVDY